jgi:hypothetical protein
MFRVLKTDFGFQNPKSGFEYLYALPNANQKQTVKSSAVYFGFQNPISGFEILNRVLNTYIPCIQGKPRQPKANQGKPRQTKANQGKPRQTKATQGNPRQTKVFSISHLTISLTFYRRI